MKKKNPHAVSLGSIRSARKAAASRMNGKLGGYRKHKKNLDKVDSGISNTLSTLQ